MSKFSYKKCTEKSSSSTVSKLLIRLLRTVSQLSDFFSHVFFGTISTTII